MTVRLAPAAVVLAGLLAAAGCAGRLDQNKTVDTGPGDPKVYDLEAASGAQKITVEFDSSNGPVEVGIFNGADAEAAEMIRQDKALKYQKTEAKGSITADVPANTPVKVAIMGLKKTTVKLRMTNQ